MNGSLVPEVDTLLNETSREYENVSSPCALGSIASRDNVTDIYWDFSLQERPAFTYARIIGQLVLFLTGVPLNIYVIARVLWKRLYTQATYLLFMNLAIGDLLICFFPIFFNIIGGFLGHFGFGNSDYERCQSCKLAAVYQILAIHSSLNIALISLDRLAFFIVPLRYSKVITSKKAGLAVAVIWGISSLFIIGPLVGYGDVGLSIMCGGIYFNPEHVIASLIQLLATASVYAIVVVILVTSNLWIACIARRQVRSALRMTTTINLNVSQEERKEVKKSRREATLKQLKLFKVFGGIILVNAIAYLPPIGMTIAILASSAVPAWNALIIHFCILSPVTFHPLVEAFFTPELSPQFCTWHGPLERCTERLVRAVATLANYTTTVPRENEVEAGRESNTPEEAEDGNDVIELRPVCGVSPQPSLSEPQLTSASQDGASRDNNTPEEAELGNDVIELHSENQDDTERVNNTPEDTSYELDISADNPTSIADDSSFETPSVGSIHFRRAYTY